MAGELRVGIVADASGLSPGLSSAEAQVKTSSANMAEAQRLATQATNNLAEAQAQLGAAAAQGNAQAAAVIAEYTTASTAAAAAVAELTAATAAQNPVMAENAAVTTAVTAATNAFGVSARQSATAGIGILEGRMMSGNRAAAAFLSTTLVLGPVLQAAFPIIGALALGEVLVDIGKGIVNFIKEAQDLAVETGTGWLQGAVLELSGFGKEIQAEEKQIQELDRQIDASIKRQKEMHFEEVGIKEGPQAEFAARAQAAAQTADGLRAAIAAQEQIIALDQKAADSAKVRLSNMTAEQVILTGFGAGFTVAGSSAAAYGEKVKEDQTELKALNTQLDELSQKSKIDVLKILPKEAKQPKESQKESQLEKDFFKDRSEGYRKETKEVEENTKALWENAQAQATKGIEQPGKDFKASGEASARAAADRREDQQFQMAMLDEEISKQNQLAQIVLTSTEGEIRLKEQMGTISHAVAAQQIQDAERTREATQRSGLEQQLALLKSEGQQYTLEYKRIQDQLDILAKKGALDREKTTEQETGKFVQQWKKADEEFNRDFTSAMNSILTKQDSVGKAFGRMLGTMELQIVDAIAKWLLQQEEAHMLAKLSDAKIAAANAYAWASAWGGPPAGAIAAGVAFAAVDAFEMGGVVRGSGGSPVPIIAHAGERVLSAGQTSNFESLVNNGGNRSATLNQENHFGGGVTEDMLAAHTQQTMSKLRGMLRPEAFQ